MNYQPGAAKAWLIRLSGFGGMWCDNAVGAADCLEADTEDTPGLVGPDMPAHLRAMNEGDIIRVGPFLVTCHMVDDTWLHSLPEHPGW